MGEPAFFGQEDEPSELLQCAEITVEKSARDCYNKHIKGTTAPYKGLAN
ncbi:hypothetical protein F220043C3_34210 [Enterocloster asparagiformis]